MRWVFLVVAVAVLFSSCKVIRPRVKIIETPYEAGPVPPPPDYLASAAWVAHPDKEDPSDEVPKGCPIPAAGDRAGVSVFFLYPTLYIGKSRNGSWNADARDRALNKKIGRSAIRYQASVFNATGRIHAPYYRQAHVSAYFSKDSVSAQRALDTAYADVLRAFKYFIGEVGGGPFIVAAHSQGTTHLIRVLREEIDGKPLASRMIAAYLVGMELMASRFDSLVPCTAPAETNCFVGWRTYATGYYPDWYAAPVETPVAINPLTWTADSAYASRDLNRGGVLWRFNKVLPRVCDAQVLDGVVRINRPWVRGRKHIKIKNYHIADYNLFYMNIRENAMLRTRAWRENNRR